MLSHLYEPVEPALGVVDVPRERRLPHPPLEEPRVRPEVHLVLEAVGLGAGLLLAVLALDQADVGEDLLVHEAAEADAEVGGDLLDGGGQLAAEFDLEGGGGVRVLRFVYLFFYFLAINKI